MMKIEKIRNLKNFQLVLNQNRQKACVDTRRGAKNSKQMFKVDLLANPRADSFCVNRFLLQTSHYAARIYVVTVER